MYKLHSFIIYIQDFTLTVLAILPIFVVGGGALCCMIPSCLWPYHLGTAYIGPYSDTAGSKMGTYRTVATIGIAAWAQLLTA